MHCFLRWFLVWCICWAQAPAWDATLSGVITDRDNGEVMPYITVVLEGAQLGAITNVCGYYAIRPIRR